MNPTYSAYASSITSGPSPKRILTKYKPNHPFWYATKVHQIVLKDNLYSVVLFDTYDDLISKETVYRRDALIPTRTYTANIPLFSHPLDRDLNILFFSQSFLRMFLYPSTEFQEYSESDVPILRRTLSTVSSIFGRRKNRRYFRSCLRFLLLRRFSHRVFRNVPYSLRLRKHMYGLWRMYKLLRSLRRKRRLRWFVPKLWRFERRSARYKWPVTR